MFLTVMTVARGARRARAGAAQRGGPRRSGARASCPRATSRAASCCPRTRARPSTATRCARPTRTRRRETLPAFLEVTGAVAMGRAPEGEVGPGAAMAIPTGGLLPHGADAVVMVEHTTEPMPGHVELLRARRAGRRRAARRARRRGRATCSRRPGRPLRAADLGLLAAAGVTEIAAHARAARRDRLDRRRGRARRRRRCSSPARCATPARRRSPGSCARPAASRCCAASCPTTPTRSSARSAASVAEDDLVVVSAGSSVGARDLTATVVGAARARSSATASRCGPGKPTLLADCGGVPLVGLPGNPRSALVVFRLVGVPLVRTVGGVTVAAAACRRCARGWRATCRAPPGGSTSCRRRCATASRRRCSAPRRCSGRWRARTGGSACPRPTPGLGAGAEVEVIAVRREAGSDADAPSVSRVPPRRPAPPRRSPLARRARTGRAARGGRRAARRRRSAASPRRPSGRCAPPPPTTRPRWTGSPCAPPTRSARRRRRRGACRASPSSTPATRCPTASTRS